MAKCERMAGSFLKCRRNERLARWNVRALATSEQGKQACGGANILI